MLPRIMEFFHNTRVNCLTVLLHGNVQWLSVQNANLQEPQSQQQYKNQTQRP